MKVHEVMTWESRIVAPMQTLEEAARLMREIDTGFLIVGEGDALVGTLTDRDIVVRGLANGLGRDAIIRDVMSREIRHCFEDQDLEEVTRLMGQIQLHRLPVLDRDKHLVGILSLGDVAVASGEQMAGHALTGISRPHGEHDQSIQCRDNTPSTRPEIIASSEG